MYKRFRHILLLIILISGALQTFAQIAMPDTVCVGTDRKYEVTGSVGSIYTWKVNGELQSSSNDFMDYTWLTVGGPFTLEVQEFLQSCSGDVQTGLVTVIGLPKLDTQTDVVACDSYSLPVVIPGINLSGNEAYYDNSQALGGKPITGPITETQPVWIYDETGTKPNCFDEISFTVTIHHTPEITNPGAIVACDSYELPAIAGNNLTASVAYYNNDPALGGTVISGTITSSQTVWIFDETGTTPNCSDLESFQVTINLSPEITNPGAIVACDFYELPAIAGNNLTASVAYYNNDPALGGTVISGTITSSQTVWIFDETGTTPNCSDIESFEVTIHPTPEITNPGAIVACDSYELPAIAGNNLTASVAYYNNDPALGGTVISGTITTSQTVWIFDETGTTPNCSDIESFEVTIHPTPEITNPGAIVACDSYELPAIAGNNLTASVAYYNNDPALGGTVISGTLTTSQTVWIFDETGTTPNCSDLESFVVTIHPTPEITNPGAIVACDFYELPAIAGNNLTASAAYFNNDPALGGTVISGTLTTSQTVWIFDETGTTPNCSDLESFVVTIHPTPEITNPGAIVACDFYELPAIAGNNLTASAAYFNNDPALGGTVISGTITSSQTVWIFDETETTPNCSDLESFVVTIHPTPEITNPGAIVACDFYELPAIAGNNLTASVAYYNNDPALGGTVISGTITSSQTVLIFDETGTTPNCSDLESFVVTIHPTPEITNPGAIVACDFYELPAIAGNNLTASVAYYNNDPALGGTVISGTITSSQTVWIFDETGTTPNCSDIESFEVTIHPTPEITNPGAIVACDFYELPAIAGNNLTASAAYYNADPALGGTVISGTITSSQTVWIFDETGTTPNCSDLESFQITINRSPEITNPGAIVACDFYELPAIAGNNLTASVAYYNNDPALGGTVISGTITSSQTVWIFDQTNTIPNCSDKENFQVTINPLPSVVVTDPLAVCEPATIDLTVASITTGSDTGLSFGYFTDALATMILADPSAVAVGGTYYIKATNPATGCFIISPVTITINPLPNVVVTDPLAVCEPSTIDLTAASITTGSDAGLSFGYFTDALATTILADPAAVAVGGTYYIKATNPATGCFIISPVTITVNPEPQLIITDPLAVCEPATIDLTAVSITTGSDAGLSFGYFTDALATTILADAAAVAVGGTYYIKATNPATGCFIISPVTITVNPEPQLIITDPLAVCEPATIDLTAASITTGSDAGLSFGYFTDALATMILADPAAVAVGGTYYIKATNPATGCLNIKPVTITINPLPNVVITDPLAVCAPSTIDLTAASITTGSDAGLSFGYFTDALATTILADPAAVAVGGTYYIKATNPATGCFIISPVTITVNPEPQLIITDPLAVCEPATIDLTAASITTGSDAGLSFGYFTDALATMILADPAAVAVGGTYYIKATNPATGCFIISPVTITVNPEPQLIITDPLAVCEPATIDLTAASITTGSDAGLSFGYFTDALATTILVDPAAVAVGGTYYIKATNPATGCFVISPVTITVNPEPQLIITDPLAVCAPATIDLTAASITTGSDAGLSFGYFTDALGTTILANPAAVAVGGTYYVKATNPVTGCFIISPVTITINPLPNVVVTDPLAVCAPATIDLTAASITTGSDAGLSFGYFTDALATTILADAAAVAVGGTYYIKATNPATGCFVISPVTITINPLPNVVVTDPLAVCAPATIDLTAASITTGSDAGLSFGYFTDALATTILADPAAVDVDGTYYIKATNSATGCFIISPVTITVNPEPQLIITDPLAVCEPSTIDLTAASITTGSDAGLSFGYFTDALATTILANPAAVAVGGTYYIKATNPATGCFIISPVTITVNPEPQLIITDPLAVCEPSTIDLTAASITTGSDTGLSFGYFTDALATMILADPTAVAVGGTYYIKATNPATGCFIISPVTITINPLPNVVVTDPLAVCAPSTIDLTAASITTGSDAGLSFGYFTDALATMILADPTAVAVGGTYYIKATNPATGCFIISPVTITVNPEPQLIITDPLAVCEPATIDLTAASITTGSDAGLSFGYFTDALATMILADPAAVAVGGTYYIKATNPATGCLNIKPVTITINPLPNVVITDPLAVCAPSTIDLTAASITTGSDAGLSFGYFTDALATTILADPAAVAVGGTYYIKATNPATGCFIISPVTITVNPEPQLIITDPLAVCAPATIDLTAASITTGSDAGLSFGYFTDALATTILADPAAVAVGGTYYIKATNPVTGCFIISPVTITVNPEPQLIITDPLAVCEPATIDLTAASITTGSDAGLSFGYFTDALATMILADPAAVAVGGTYYIKATNPATGCLNIKPVTITINPLPNVVITDPLAVCAPSTIDLTAASITTGSDAGLSFGYFTDALATMILADPATVAVGGTYYIKATNPATGCFIISPVTITVNPEPQLIITDPLAVCEPATIDLTAVSITTGSDAGLSFGYFTDALATTILADPAAVAVGGTYYIKATNPATGCFIISPVTITVNPEPQLIITDPLAVCEPATIDLTAAAITAGSTISPLTVLTYWTDPAATTMLSSPGSVSASGSYFIKATDLGGCFDIQLVTVVVNPLPILVINNPVAVCEPETIDLTAAPITAGSEAGLSYEYFSDISGTLILTNPTLVVSSGTYYIKAVDSTTGCFAIKSVNVTINSLPKLSINNPAATCAPATINLTASVITTGSDANLSYGYFTDALASTVLADPTAVSVAGTYYIKGTNPTTGCSSIKPVIIEINPQPVLIITNPLAVCESSTIDLTTSSITAGSDAGLTYGYYTNASASTVLVNYTAVTVAGTYYIKATNPTTGCFTIKSVQVTINPLPKLTINSPVAVCEPATIDLTAASITAGSDAGLSFGYFTDALATTILADPAAVAVGGTYYIKATNPATGCLNIKPVTITINPLPNVVITDPLAVCAPATIDLTAASINTGSDAGLTFGYFSDPSASITLTNFNAVAVEGTYYIKATHKVTGCFTIQPVAIKINPQPQLIINDPLAVCEPSVIDLSAASITAGSDAGLSFGYFSDASATKTLSNFTEVASGGTYYIKATNTVTGCFTIKPVTVTIILPPVLIINDPVAVCEPLTIDLTAASITTGSESNLNFGYYTDALATEILVNPAMVSTGGTYYIKATIPATGCFTVKPVTITISSSPKLAITNPDAVCEPTTIDLTASAITAGSTDPASSVLSYWTDAGATTALNNPSVVSASGTYFIKFIALGGCFDIQPVTVNVNPQPNLVITDPVAVCEPSAIDLTVASITAGSDAGLTYEYYTDALATAILANPARVVVGGTYYIKAINTTAGCFMIKPVVVTISPSPKLILTNPDAVCEPEIVDLTDPAITTGSAIPASSVFTYWTDAGATNALTNPTVVSAAGTYFVKVVALGGCFDVQPVTVIVNPQPKLVITDPLAVCEPSTINLTAASIKAGSDAGLTYEYFTDASATTILANPAVVSAGGTYYVKAIKTTSGCFVVKPVIVTISPSPKLTITNPDAVCEPGTVDLTASDITAGSTIPASSVFTYWTNAGATNALNNETAVSASGTYFVKVMALGGCSDIHPITVVVNPQPVLVITDPEIVCEPATIDLSASSITAGSDVDLTYEYFTDASASTSLIDFNAVTVNGTYYIKATNTWGCEVIKPVTVHINLPVDVVMDPIPNLCWNGTAPELPVILGNGITGTWNPATISTAIAGITTYIFTPDAGQCTAPYNLNVEVSNPIVITSIAVPIDVNHISGSIDLTVSGGTGPNTYTYQWDNGATTEDLTNLAQGIYKVVVTDENGCTAAETVIVKSLLLDITCPPAPEIENLVDLPAPYKNTFEWILYGGTINSNGCNVVSVEMHKEELLSGLCPPVVSRIYKIADDCGNVAFCEQIIKLKDKTPPVFDILPEDIVVQCTPPAAYVNYNDFVNNGKGKASDNCNLNIGSFKMSETNNGSSCPLIFTRTYVIEDNSGNQSLPFIHTVTIHDTEKPVITCPPTKHYLTLAEVPSVFLDKSTIAFISSGGIILDNCGENKLTFRFVPGSETNDTESFPKVITRRYEISDFCGNTNFCDQTITYGPFEFTAVVTPTPLSCFGSNDGKITITNQIGGSGLYDYSKDNGATWQETDVYTGLAQGAYQVWLRDRTNPSIKVSLGTVNINEPVAMSLSATGIDSPCNGVDASIQFAFTNIPDGLYDILYDGGQFSSVQIVGSKVLVPAPVGTYDNLRMIINGCSTVGDVDVILTEPLIMTIAATGTDSPCNGGDGSIQFTFTNVPDGNYDVLYDGGQFSEVPVLGNKATIPAPARIYNNLKLVINGCSTVGQADIAVKEPFGMLLTASVTNQPTCDVATGTISVTTPAPASGITYTVIGTSPVKAAITNVTGLFEVLTAGTYDITTTGADGCISVPVSLTVIAQPVTPAAPVAIALSPTCAVATGTITVTTPAPVAGNSYTLTGTNPVVLGKTNSTGVFAGLTSGIYNLTTTNAAGCTSAATIETIGVQPATPADPIASLAQPTCGVATGTITVTAPVPGAGVSYTVTGVNPVAAAITNLSGEFPGLNPGIYNLSTTNAVGCISAVKSLTIIVQPATPADPIALLTQPTCGVATGAIKVTTPAPGAGVAYSVTGINPVVASVANSTGVFSGLTPGIYSITSTNASGCFSASVNYTIDPQPVTPADPIADIIQPTCTVATGTITVTSPAPGVGVSYTVKGTSPVKAAITNATGLFPGLSSGTYDVTTSIGAGCSSAAISMRIEAQPATPVAPVAKVTPPTCDVATGTITVTTPVSGTIYTLTGTNPVVPAVTNLIGVFPELTSGDYQITATNAVGCTSVASSHTIGVQPVSPAEPVAKVTQPICDVATGTITVTSPAIGAGISYTITGINPVVAAVTNLNGVFSGLKPGIYDVTTTNFAGCSSTALSLTIEPQPVKPGAPIVKLIPPTCDVPTGTIEVTAPLGSTFKYSLDGIVYQKSPLFDGLLPDNYSVTAKDTVTTCESLVTPLTVNPVPKPPLAPIVKVDQHPTCNDPNGTIIVTNPKEGTGYEYSLNGGAYQASSTFDGLIWGKHFVRVKQIVTTCESDTTMFTVNAIPPAPTLAAIPEDSKCFEGDGSISFVFTDVTDGLFTINYDGGQFDNVDIRNNLATVIATKGIYNNLTIAANGCISGEDVDVIIAQPDSILISEKITEIDYKSGRKGAISLTLSGGTGSFSYSWSTGETIRDIENLSDGSYTVIVTDVNGCQQEKTIVIPLPNLPPVALNDEFISGCSGAAGNLLDDNGLGADYDPENDSFFIDTIPIVRPIHGILTLNTDGSFQYLATPGYSGMDTLQYAIYDVNHYLGDTATVVIHIVSDFDCDGLADELDPDADGDGILNVNEGSLTADSDDDGHLNWLDIDADNDGIVDNIEAQSTRDYIIPSGNDVNVNGVDDAYDTTKPGGVLIIPVDTDGEGVADFVDADSDNDFVPDYIEGNDVDANGRPDYGQRAGKDIDSDGLDDAFDRVDRYDSPGTNATGSIAISQDFDGDGMKDWRDENDDDDVYLTRFEDLNMDSDFSNDDIDFDGHPEYLDFGRDCDLFIPDAFSPNGDNVHDYFQIYCIDHFPNAKMYIFDQVGNKIFELSDYGNLTTYSPDRAWWDGRTTNRSVATNNGMVLPGTYFYVLQLGNGEVKKSSVFVSY